MISRTVFVAGLPGWRESKDVGDELKWLAGMKKPRDLLDPNSLCARILSLV